MDAVREIILMACTALIVGEILYFLTPKDKVTDAVYGLVYTAVIVSAVLSFTKIDLNLDFTERSQAYQQEIDAIISEAYLTQTEAEMKEIITGALDTVHIPCKSIDFVMRLDEGGELQLERLAVQVQHQSDCENARVILDQLFENTIEVEVQSESE